MHADSGASYMCGGVCMDVHDGMGRGMCDGTHTDMDNNNTHGDIHRRSAHDGRPRFSLYLGYI